MFLVIPMIYWTSNMAHGDIPAQLLETSSNLFTGPHGTGPSTITDIWWSPKHVLVRFLVIHDVHFHVLTELTVVYVTARTFDTQIAAKEQLDLSRQTTDETLHYLKYWPGIDEDGHMYQSSYLFSAVLEHHRTLVKVSCAINQVFRPQPHSFRPGNKTSSCASKV